MVLPRHSLGIACRARATGLVLAEWERDSPVVTFRESLLTTTLPTDVAREAKRLAGGGCTTTLDPGVYGSEYAVELARRSGLPAGIVLDTAGKQYLQKKRAAQELMAEAMRARLVHVAGCSALVADWRRAIWKSDRAEQEEADLPLADASLWAWVACGAFAAKPKPKPLTPAEAASKMELDMEAAALRSLEPDPWE
jgi:hypothetical protein